MAGKAQGQEGWSDDEPPLLENSGAQHTPGSGATHTIAVNNQCDGDEAQACIMDEMVTIATKAKAAKRLHQEKERNSTDFGVGLKKGFFNQSKATKAKSARGKTERLEMSEMSAIKKVLQLRTQTDGSALADKRTCHLSAVERRCIADREPSVFEPTQQQISQIGRVVALRLPRGARGTEEYEPAQPQR
jgi:hypothetical protein